MAYQTYTTEAVVCGAWSKNTSDKSYLLFTRDAGMLYADARSVREEKSKQRFGLQDFSRIKVSLVKGKAGWRIGSVEAIENYYQSASDKAARGSVVALAKFLRRFYKGEEAAPELYDFFVSAIATLSQDVPNRSVAEMITQLRILADLGYVDRKKIPTTTLASDLLTILNEQEEKVVSKLIEHATTSSQL